MKKAILILLVPFMIKGQATEITAVTPSVITAGDSIFISFKLIPGNNLQINLQGSSANMIWQYALDTIRSKFFDRIEGGDTLYLLQVRTSSNIGPGAAVLSTIFGLNTVTIQVLAPVGLPEQLLQDPDPLYFDFYGNQVKRLEGVIQVEQVGIRRRKVLFTSAQ